MEEHLRIEYVRQLNNMADPTYTASAPSASTFKKCPGTKSPPETIKLICPFMFLFSK